jgi:hypothetical protein
MFEKPDHLFIMSTNAAIHSNRIWGVYMVAVRAMTDGIAEKSKMAWPLRCFIKQITFLLFAADNSPQVMEIWHEPQNPR